MIIKNGETQPTFTIKAEAHEMYDFQCEQQNKVLSDLNGYWVIIERDERYGKSLIAQLGRHEGEWVLDESLLIWAFNDDLDRFPL